MKGLSDVDCSEFIKRYSSRYKQFGYSPKTLGWDKGKQEIRFSVLTSQYDFEGKTVLDVGCGFADLYRFLTLKCQSNFKYIGIDLVSVLIEQAKKLWKGDNISLEVGDFLSMDLDQEQVDYVIGSGVFNRKLKSTDNMRYVRRVLERSYRICRDGLAFDFLSDKVDFKLKHTFHYSPVKLLEYAYRLSRNVVLRNDYMPFEFSLFLFKDDSFDREDTIFRRFKATEGCE